MGTESVNRRGFFKRTAGAAVGAAAASTALLSRAGETGQASTASPLEPINDTLRMQDDLRRALKKPVAQRKWGMVIDIRKCIGCSACTVACIAENNLPPGVTYRIVQEVEDGEYPDLRRFFMPTNCMQCGKPPCVEAANKLVPGAMSRRPDGIVAVDYQKLRGKEVFEAAKKACPYTALYFDEDGNYTDSTPAVQPYEKRTSQEYGRTLTRKETEGVGRKCHFCIQRIEAGVLPACVTTCTGQAMHFGDLNDPESLVVGLLSRSKWVRLEESEGTDPKVYYLDDDPQETCMKCHG